MAKTVKERFEKYYCTLNGRASHMLNNAKQRAKRSNLPFELTKEWLINKLKLGKCEVTGLPFTFVINGGRGHHVNSFSPSLDRVAPNLGYTPDNVQVVCWIYNRARGAFPLEDLKTMVKALTS